MPCFAHIKRQWKVVTTFGTGYKMAKAPTGVSLSVTFLIMTLWTNSGMVFIVVSYKMLITKQHNTNGYLFLILHSSSLLMPTPQIQPHPRLASRQCNRPNHFGPRSIPHKHYNTIWFNLLWWIHYLTCVTYVSGQLQSTSVGLNHNLTAGG